MSDQRLSAQIIQWLKESGETVAVAESCTGGQLSAALTAVPGASKVFLGGVVAYSNSAKVALLGVRSTTLKEHGAVSAECALEMAVGAKERFGSNWGLAVTGIAGPTGGTKTKPVGTVWIALVGPDTELAEIQNFEDDRAQIASSAVTAALRLLATRASSPGAR